MVTKKTTKKKAAGKRPIKDLDAKCNGGSVKGGGGLKIHGPGPVGPGGTGG